MSHTIDRYLQLWEDHREAGMSVSPSDLCADWPEGRDELLRHIRMLEACDRLLNVEDTPPETSRTLPTPAVVAGYMVREELGRGGMGVVYRVWDTSLRREAALKMLRPSGLSALPDEAKRLSWRFQQEAQVLAQLEHPHIVRVFEACVAEETPYFIMEYVKGGSLASRLVQMTTAGPQVIVPFLEKVARAVHYAHSQGVLHRDLKPANIFLEVETGEKVPSHPRVGDFGLAKLLSQDVEHDDDTAVSPPHRETTSTMPDASRLTISGYQPGTPAYMAPEQYDKSFGPISPATDVWAMGVILYELLTGHKPFGRGSREELRHAVCETSPTRPRSHRALERIVLRCLEKDPRNRYPTAKALADDLARWGKRRQRLRWLVACTIGVVMLIALAGVIVRETNPERQYERGVRTPLAKLARGEAIELIEPGQTLPPYRVRCGEGHTRVRMTEKGLSVDSPTLGLVELLPRVPVPHYRIEATLRHVNGWNWRNGMGGVGIVFSGRHVASAAGAHNLVGIVGFDDWATTFQPPPGNLRKGIAKLRLLWYLENPADGITPFKREFHSPDNYSTPYDPIVGNEKPVRTVIVDVTPQAITMFWESVATPKLGPLRPDDYESFERVLRKYNDELTGVSIDPIHQPTIGLYVFGGHSLVQRLRVIPLPSSAD